MGDHPAVRALTRRTTVFAALGVVPVRLLRVRVRRRLLREHGLAAPAGGEEDESARTTPTGESGTWHLA